MRTLSGENNHRVALLVGVGHYKNKKDLAPLEGVHTDLSSLRKVLSDPAIGNYTVEVLEDVDSRTACQAIEKFLNCRSAQDTAIIYYSGHGFIDRHGHLYLCTSDSDFGTPKSSTIRASVLTELIDACDSKRILVLLDSCYSGSFENATKGAGLVASEFEGSGFGRVVLTAGQEKQMVWQDKKNGSVFTKHLVAGLRTGAADRDGDGAINVQELYDYVYKAVVTERPRQRPGKSTYREDGPAFVVANRLVSDHPSSSGLHLTRSPIVSNFERAWKKIAPIAQICLLIAVALLPAWVIYSEPNLEKDSRGVLQVTMVVPIVFGIWFGRYFGLAEERSRVAQSVLLISASALLAATLFLWQKFSPTWEVIFAGLAFHFLTLIPVWMLASNVRFVKAIALSMGSIASASSCAIGLGFLVIFGPVRHSEYVNLVHMMLYTIYAYIGVVCLWFLLFTLRFELKRAWRTSR